MSSLSVSCFCKISFELCGHFGSWSCCYCSVTLHELNTGVGKQQKYLCFYAWMCYCPSFDYYCGNLVINFNTSCHIMSHTNIFYFLGQSNNSKNKENIHNCRQIEAYVIQISTDLVFLNLQVQQKGLSHLAFSILLTISTSVF